MFVEDNLGFPVFEAIEAGKRALSDAERAHVRYSYPGDRGRRAGRARATSTRSSARATARDPRRARRDAGHAPALAAARHRHRVLHRRHRARAGRRGRARGSASAREKLTQFQHFHSVVHGLADRARELA